MSNSKLTVNVFDGARQLLGADFTVLTTIIDGFGKILVRKEYPCGTAFELPFYDNFGDNFSVVVFHKKFQQAGFMPVRCTYEVGRTLDLMLVKKKPSFSFRKWNELPAGKLRDLLDHGAATENAARDRFNDLMEDRPSALACVLNIATAIDAIHLPAANALQYFRDLIWDESMAQDRFYAWADPELLNQVKQAALKDLFVREAGFAIFHHGATDSYKQVQFGEANVQFTFHENDRKEIDGLNCIRMEMDVDYFKDLAAHAILEVITNGLSGNLTDPRQVYVLRWMAGRNAGVAPFEPPYVLC